MRTLAEIGPPARAWLVVSDAASAEVVHRWLEVLVVSGLRSATLLCILPPPDESKSEAHAFLDDASLWAQRFEARGLERVEVTFKRGDPAAWLRELAAMRPDHWVVAVAPRAAPDGFLRPASPWRNLPVPVLLLPPSGPGFRGSLFDRVVVAIKDPRPAREDVLRLVRALPAVRAWEGVYVAPSPRRPGGRYPIPLKAVVGDRYAIADSLVACARAGARLLVLFARPEDVDETLAAGYVTEGVVRSADVPVLLWPARPAQPRRPPKRRSVS
jgi:nucleotide-binding universal stress UspA family protein